MVDSGNVLEGEKVRENMMENEACNIFGYTNLVKRGLIIILIEFIFIGLL